MWEELKQELGRLQAKTVDDGPLWEVQGSNGVTLHAHPAFLDEARTRGRLQALLTEQGRERADAIRGLRVMPASRLEELPTVRKELRLEPGVFSSPAEQLHLLERYYPISNMGVVLSGPGALDDAAAFANAQNPASAQDYVDALTAYLAIAQALIQVQARAQAQAQAQAVYASAQHHATVKAVYKLARNSASDAGPLRLGEAADWPVEQPDLPQAVKVRAQDLNFRTANALIGHVMKHLEMGADALPQTQPEMDAMFTAYLKEARDNITAVDVGTVTSALAQAGATRTYYFGGEQAAARTMVACAANGNVWISTYYRSGRV